MRVAVAAFTVTVTAAVTAGWTLVAAATPNLAPSTGRRPVYRVCHPVDDTDVADDRWGIPQEVETLDDEGEIGCVNGRRFRVLRSQLRHGQRP